FAWLLYTKGEIVLTQKPSVKSVLLGDQVTLDCMSSSSSFTSSLAWYLQRPGEKPKLLFSSVGSRVSGTPSRFSDGRSGTVFSLTIKGVQPEDVGDYYCQQYYELPLTQ
uniref:Ig-like domain-containing protein n=1 Tax=Erpetoichthys calabaricus TaxID=27687 RepID=A0A8C4RFL6_ERPCA